MNILPFIVYDASGRIIKVGSCPDDHVDLQANTNLGESACVGECNPYTDYVVNGAPMRRPDMPATLDGNSMVGVPMGATVYVDGNVVLTISMDEPVHMEFTDIGVYTIKVECWPYLDKSFVVSA